ncbi:hypothetical protein V8C35DRAFT_280774 [Trichoderma chlorosporum]
MPSSTSSASIFSQETSSSTAASCNSVNNPSRVRFVLFSGPGAIWSRTASQISWRRESSFNDLHNDPHIWGWSVLIFTPDDGWGIPAQKGHLRPLLEGILDQLRSPEAFDEGIIVLPHYALGGPSRDHEEDYEFEEEEFKYDEEEGGKEPDEAGDGDTPKLGGVEGREPPSIPPPRLYTALLPLPNPQQFPLEKEEVLFETGTLPKYRTPAAET